MNNFFVILRDSFREAVDGFVIYVMLALSTIMIFLIASISFTPRPAEEALPGFVKMFVLYIPDKGQSEAVGAVAGTDYAAREIKRDRNDVKFVLEVTSLKNPLAGDGDPFRTAVAGWAKKPFKPEKIKLPKGALTGQAGASNEETELLMALKPEVTAAEADAVTDAQMEEFLRDQFRAHASLTSAKVTRLPEPAAGKYAFDCEVPGALQSRSWPVLMSFFFGAAEIDTAPLGLGLFLIEDQVVNGIGSAITLLISVIITAFFIPNLLRKGALDLIIAKPIGRVPLLIYKYLGGCTFIFLIALYTIGAVWIVLGVRTGHFDPRFLVVVPAVTFTFALLYAFSTLVGVFTRSAIAAILLTVGFAFFLYIVGAVKSRSDRAKLLEQNWAPVAHQIIDGVNYGLPRYKDLDKITTKIIAEGTLAPIQMRIVSKVIEFPSWYGTIGLSLGWIALMLALASWRVHTRDG